MKNIKKALIVFSVVALFVALFVVMPIAGKSYCEKQEAEAITEEINATVTHCDMVYVKSVGTKCYLSVSCDEYSGVFDVDRETYAQYAVGDTIILYKYTYRGHKGMRTKYDIHELNLWN